MFCILAFCAPLQVFNTVIRLDAIFVIHTRQTIWVRNEVLSNETMQKQSLCFAVFCQSDFLIAKRIDFGIEYLVLIVQPTTLNLRQRHYISKVINKIQPFRNSRTLPEGCGLM